MAQLGLLVSEDPEEEKRQKEFKSFLNKITPDNYETIREKIIAVGIDSPGTLQGLIDQARSPSLYFPNYRFVCCLCFALDKVSMLLFLPAQTVPVTLYIDFLGRCAIGL